MTAIYIHIPFCSSRCHYCDFATYSGLEQLLPEYVDSLCSEVRAAPSTVGTTAYIGGGTPSLIPPSLVTALVDELRHRFSFPVEAEFTFEANPGSLDLDYLRVLRELGINRISLGAQSSHTDELELLGRQHTWHHTVEALTAAREAGFGNLSLDLIYGLPGQTLDRWENTLQAALQLEPDHLSVYALSLERGTLLEKQVSDGTLPAPEEDTAATMFLQWFITEQVEEEKNASDILAKLDFIREDSAGILMLDKELGARSQPAAEPAAE